MRLSEDLRKWRADRPDEWTMDRFINEATRLELVEEKFTSTNTGSPKLPPSCDVCPFGYVCRCSGQRGCRDCNDAWRQLRAGA